MGRGKTIGPVALTLLALMSVDARASEVVLVRVPCTGGDECRYFQETTYHKLVGAPGERNRVTVSATPDGTETIVRDYGAPIREVADCARIDDHAVRCRAGILRVEAGDLDDFVAVGASAYADGGEGDDELVVRDFGYVSGGPGRDVVRGGPYGDYLSDGDAGADGDADVFDGGGGADVVNYGVSRERVTVDLSRPGSTAGEDGEGDTLVSVEGAVGGSAGDTLTAGEAFGALSGGGGHDRLTGGAARNTIEPGPGNDVVAAGGGADLVDLERGGGRDRIACGADADEVFRPGRAALLDPDCERTELWNDGVVTSLAPLRSLLRPVMRVAPFGCGSRLRTVTELRVARTHRRRGMPRAGTLVARRRVGGPRCRGRSAAVKLLPAGRRALRRHGRLPVQVRVFRRGHDDGVYLLDLKRPSR